MPRIVLLFALFFSLNAAASHREAAVIFINQQTFSELSNNPPKEQLLKKIIPFLQKHTVENKRVTAMILTVLLGPLGVHRLYLGTDAFVPIVYVCTLGGGLGILPFIDLVVLGFSEDVSRFQDNTRIFMWINKN